jgi:hypothetical protein
MRGSNASHGASYRERHARSGPLGVGADAAVASAESDGPRKLAREETPFGHRLLRSIRVAALVCFFKIGLDLGEAAAVRLLRAPVEYLAGIARQRERCLAVEIAVVR